MSRTVILAKKDPGGLLACEPSGLNEELKLARQANEFQHQTIKKQAAQIATMRELLLLSKNGSNAAYQEAVQKALAIQPDDSALQAFAEKVREQCAEICDLTAKHGNSAHYAAAAIRHLKELG